MAVIKVPKPQEGSFNKNRPVSALLKGQILHLHEVERKFPPSQHSGIYINAIKTEGDAAAYIKKVTARLHPEGAKRVRFDIAAAAAKSRPSTKPKRKSKKKKS
jgi:hypothetical protein